MKRLRLTPDKTFFLLFGLTFFIGIWHALPILNVISDEMYFVGGVLRAMEHHTIIPAVDDVPYGTITYLLNYAATIFWLIVLLPFFSFKLSALKFYLLVSPTTMYLSTRIVSAIIGLFYLYVILKLLKKEDFDRKNKYLLTILLFSNIITTVIMHTGKMWVLSVFLEVVSFYFLYLSVATGERHKQDRHTLLTIIFSFLALSNLPLNAFTLINIPILWFYRRSEQGIIKKLLKYTVIGALIALPIIALNYHGIKDQIISVFTGYNPILVKNPTLPKMTFWVSLSTYTKKLLALFPLPILAILLSIKNGVRNRKLLSISLIYFFVYFSAIVMVARWPVEFGSFLRYLVSLNFFLFFILISLHPLSKKFLYPIVGISCVYFALTLYYLSISTTYNHALNWVNINLSEKNITIIDNIRDFRLTKNKASSLLSQDIYCGTKCKATIDSDLNKNFLPLVLDDQSVNSATSSMKNFKGVYLIEERQTTKPDYILIAQFTNPTKDYHSVDYNMGNYFDLDYFKIRSLGKNIYIYQAQK